MKIKLDLQALEANEFDLRMGKVGGETVVLINPRGFPKWTQDLMIFRSSVWTMNGELISAGFKKFFNYTEAPHLVPDPTDADIAQGEFLEKLDGCCDENTIIHTEDGDKTIKEICDIQYQGKILAFDHKTGKEVWVKVQAFSVQENNDDWYELELADGKTIRLTGNHRVWLPKLNCYRMVKDLEGNEEVLLKN